MIKYGIKIWSINRDWFEETVVLFREGKIGFVELYLVPEHPNLKDLISLKKIPVAVHIPHYEHDFNIFNLDSKTLQFFKSKVVGTADFFKSQFIILHGGVGKNREYFKKNIAKVRDRRLLIENMPRIGLDGRICFGYSLEQLKFIKEECGLDICLDLAHAIKTAIALELDYKDFVLSLIVELNPCYFHISGGRQDNVRDEHLNLFEGDFDIEWIKGNLLKAAEKKTIFLVFETPKNKNDLKNDIKNIDYFKKT